MKTISRTAASISDLEKLLAQVPFAPVVEIAPALRVCRERVYDLIEQSQIELRILPAGSRLVNVQSALTYAIARHQRIQRKKLV